MFHNEISEETRGEKRTESNGGESTRGVFWRHVCGYGGRRSARRLRLGREAPQEASKHRKKVWRNSDEDRKMTVMTDVWVSDRCSALGRSKTYQTIWLSDLSSTHLIQLIITVLSNKTMITNVKQHEIRWNSRSRSRHFNIWTRHRWFLTGSHHPLSPLAMPSPVAVLLLFVLGLPFLLIAYLLVFNLKQRLQVRFLLLPFSSTDHLLNLIPIRPLHRNIFSWYIMFRCSLCLVDWMIILMNFGFPSATCCFSSSRPGRASRPFLLLLFPVYGLSSY